MFRFHRVDGTEAIVSKKGRYYQLPVYIKGTEVYVKFGAAFIRAYRDGSSVPDIRVLEIDQFSRHIMDYDSFGRAFVRPL
jgi:hypothetical protein